MDSQNIDDLIQPSVEDDTNEGNDELVIEESVEEEQEEVKVDPDERFTKPPVSKIKARNRKRNKQARMSRKRNRK